MTQEVALTPLEITQEQRIFVEKILDKATNTKIAELFRSIGASGYSAITARIEVVDLVWDALEAVRSELEPNDDFVVWERYSQPKTFNRKNAEVVPMVFYNNMFVLWMFPMLEMDKGMKIEENTYVIWHTLAKFKDVLALYKPATIKDARKIITAVKNGDEEILLKYCIDDSDVENIINKVKEASGDSFASKGGNGKAGRPEVDPSHKAFLLFSRYAAECLTFAIPIEDLEKRLKTLAARDQGLDRKAPIEDD